MGGEPRTDRPTWSITLVDSSQAMVEAAREKLGDQATYAIARTALKKFRLPATDEPFDRANAYVVEHY
jgi:ubiquinone/menaquinone biosynthesis C-methylase UbiE